MAGASVNQLVAQLAQPAPPEAAAVAARLGATLRPSEENPYWKFYTFALPAGPFAGGVLRVGVAGDAALLSLTPRDPPGIAEAEVDSAAWGPRRGAVPNPRLKPEGGDRLTYQLNGVNLSLLWTHTSRRLINLALEWPAPNPPADEEEVE